MIDSRASLQQLIQEMREWLHDPEAWEPQEHIIKWADRLALLADGLGSPLPEQDQEGELARVDEQTVIPPERATASENETTPTTAPLAFAQSFDARDWARAFVEHVTANPSIATDEGTLIGWFANAIMRGYDEAQRRAAPKHGDEWRPSEALFAFMGWLTSRDERTVLSATDNAAPAADLIKEFCGRYQLSDPREGWHRVIGGNQQPSNDAVAKGESYCESTPRVSESSPKASAEVVSPQKKSYVVHCGYNSAGILQRVADELPCRLTVREVLALRDLLGNAPAAEVVSPSLTATKAIGWMDSEGPVTDVRRLHQSEAHNNQSAEVVFQPPQEEGSFQSRVGTWILKAFGLKIAEDRTERNHRFLEEALELVQANGCTQDEARQLVEYVYSRPVGELWQETGGVLVTLAALCLANGVDMKSAGEAELLRVWGCIEKIRAKQAAKPKHSPLPASAEGSIPSPTNKGK